MVATTVVMKFGSRGSTGEGPYDVVDTAAQAGHVIGLDRGEHGDSELVAAELPVRLGVDDPVRPQHLRNHRGIDCVSEVDGAHDVAAVRGLVDEGVDEVGLLRPRIEDLRRT